MRALTRAGRRPRFPCAAAPTTVPATRARLQTGVIGNVKKCDGAWCRLVVTLPSKRDVDGYIRQNRLWGVYPNEKVE